jgi:hypothetical protein
MQKRKRQVKNDTPQSHYNEVGYMWFSSAVMNLLQVEGDLHASVVAHILDKVLLHLNIPHEIQHYRHHTATTENELL